MRARISGLVAASTLALALALTPSLAAPAMASCLFDERPMEDKIAEAEFVFVGTVDQTAHGSTTARFEVEEVWKGDIPDDITVIGGSGEDGVATSVDRAWSVGKRYLVLPFKDGDRWLDNSCSPTTEWSEEFVALRPTDADLRQERGEPTVVDVEDAGSDPAADEPGSSPALPVVAGVAGLLALGTVVWRRRQNTMDPSDLV